MIEILDKICSVLIYLVNTTEQDGKVIDFVFPDHAREVTKELKLMIERLKLNDPLTKVYELQKEIGKELRAQNNLLRKQNKYIKAMRWK